MSGYAYHRYAHSRIRSRPMQLGYLVYANVINSLETVYLVRKNIAYSSLHLKRKITYYKKERSLSLFKAVAIDGSEAAVTTSITLILATL